MNITPQELITQVHAFDHRHPGVVAAAEHKHGLPAHLLHAIGSRETNLSEFYENHPGDGGHGRGTFQLDDRSHHIPNPFPMQMQADIAGGMMHDGIARFGGNVQEACSAYNSGQGNDQYTTGHDYGHDVVARMRSLGGGSAGVTPAPHRTLPTLSEGSTDRADVETLQSALHIKVDGDFGPGTKAAVIHFQQIHGLQADGVVGAQTWHALGH
ncbi:MAG: peptidoglycan-binding protein [Ilumatobacteraceae bacterium]